MSVLCHALLLSLTFGDQASGLPGLGIPWRERRVVAPDLRIELVRAPVAAVASPGTPVTVAPKPSSVARTRVARTPTPAPATAVGRTTVMAEDKATSPAAVQPNIATDAAVAPPSSHTEGAGDAMPTSIEPSPASAADRSAGVMAVAPAADATPTPVMAVGPDVESAEVVPPAVREPQEPGHQRDEAAVPGVSEGAVESHEHKRPAHDVRRQAAQTDSEQTQTSPHEEAASVEADQRQQADRPEPARIEAERGEALRREAPQLHEAQREAAAREEAARIEAERRELERQEAARQAAQRQEAAQLHEVQRQAAAREEAARIDAERREVERQEAARQAAQRQEAAQLHEVQRQAAAREEAARIDAERREVERQEAARQAAQRHEAARVLEEQEEDARREARRRAMARQLEEEAARREAAATPDPPATLPLSLSTARRVRLWGRAHPDVELVQYAEAWALKIQHNTPVETVRQIANRPHAPALVTVAIRSDGSVESVSFELSSGAAEIDDAIRRIVESHRPYPEFPPALARRFDVIEIRRTWRFDTAVRLY